MGPPDEPHRSAGGQTGQELGRGKGGAGPGVIAQRNRENPVRDRPPLEVFVHGALCVAYSGQCLTSEALGGEAPTEVSALGLPLALRDAGRRPAEGPGRSGLFAQSPRIWTPGLRWASSPPWCVFPQN